MTLLKHTLLIIGLLALLVLLAGCGGGKNAIAEATPPLIEHFSVQVHSDDVTVDFTLLDPTESTWFATIHFSEDLGQHWSPLSGEALLDTEIQLSPPFLPVKRIWNFRSDLSSVPQADVLLEVRITNLEGDIVTRQQSDTIAIGESEAPIFTAISSPSGPVGGVVTISGSALDPDQDYLTLSMEWSATGSEPWSSATLIEESIILAPDSEGKPTPFELNWDAQLDAPELISPFAKVRLHLSDGGATTTYTSGNLAINTVQPVINLFTVGNIPSFMNGQEPYEGNGSTLIPFMLTIPSAGSLLSIEWSPGNGGAAVDTTSVNLTSDVELLGIAPGLNLAESMTTSANGAEWIITPDQALPTGTITLTATVQDIRGNVSETVEYSVEVRNGSPSVRPFDIEDRWIIDFSRDHFQVGFLDEGNGNIAPFSQSGADGISDHQQDLYTVGLQSAMGSSESNAIDAHVRALVENQVIERIRFLYEKTEVSDLQPRLSFHGTNSTGTSALGIGGDDIEPLSYALGRAVFDTKNQNFDDERQPGRGVFSSNMVQYYWGSYTFLQRFGALIPGIGDPVGTHPEDLLVLSPGFERTAPGNSASSNARFDDIWNAIEAWSRLISVVAAHEIGHAIGLCTNGHPPLGLFGGVSSADFTGPFTTPYHVDTPGNNVMSSALGLSSALVEGPYGYRFNDLNQAYIAEWIVLEN